MEELGLSREALVIYLKDLCIVETMIHQIDKKKKELQTRDSANRTWISQLREQNKENEYLLKKSQKEIERMTSQKKLINRILIIILIIIISSIFMFRLLPALFLTADIILLLGASYGLSAKSNINYMIQNENDTLNHYRTEFRMNEQKISELQTKRNRMAKIMSEGIKKLDSNRKQLEPIREEAYNMGLIPYSSDPALNCRTLAGVMHLYEFMSTTRESLSAALYHFKLDSIISRLDTLINKIETMIHNQQTMMQKQDETLQEILKIEKQQQQTTKTLENIKDYTEIIKINSDIQTALALDALYYQNIELHVKI